MGLEFYEVIYSAMDAQDWQLTIIVVWEKSTVRSLLTQISTEQDHQL